MTRTLPKGANLEHLKKQAKSLLRDVLSAGPGTVALSRTWLSPST